jgi:hypothetical protein
MDARGMLGCVPWYETMLGEDPKGIHQERPMQSSPDSE